MLASAVPQQHMRTRSLILCHCFQGGSGWVYIIFSYVHVGTSAGTELMWVSSNQPTGL